MRRCRDNSVKIQALSLVPLSRCFLTNSFDRLYHLAGWITPLLDYLKTPDNIYLLLLGLFDETVEFQPLVYQQTLGGK